MKESPGVTGRGTGTTTRPEHELAVIKLGVLLRGSRGGRPLSAQRCHRPRQRLPSRPRPLSRCGARRRDQGCARGARPGTLRLAAPGAQGRAAASGRASRAGQAPDLTFLSGLARPLAVPDAATVGASGSSRKRSRPALNGPPLRAVRVRHLAAPPPRARPKQLLLGPGLRLRQLRASASVQVGGRVGLSPVPRSRLWSPHRSSRRREP